MEQIAMPQLGETVTEGTITRWLKQVGDEVAEDDPLFEVSTDKVDTEVPSAYAGYLRAVLVEEGDTVPIGTTLAVLTATADEPIDPPSAPVAAPTEPPSELARGGSGRDGTGARARPAADGNGDGTGFLSPVVRQLLTDHGLEPRDVLGSGRNGRITRNDVLAAAANRSRTTSTVRGTEDEAVPHPEAGPDDDAVGFTKARRNTAASMLRSVTTAAHALVVSEVDYSAVDASRRSASLTFLPYVARAVIDAIGVHPEVNATVGDDELIVHRKVHLGIAVDLDFSALVVPVVRNAGGLRLRPLADAIVGMAEKAKAKHLTVDDLSGATFTITNVGSYGTLVTSPIINLPQVAILSTDGVAMKPVAVRLPDGTWGLAVHPVGNLCLSFDHRAFDGAYAASFLAMVRTVLETRDWSEET